MGIGIVLIFWGVAGLAGATLGSAILSWLTSWYVNGNDSDCRRLRFSVRLFPFLCLAWAAGVFLFYATVNGIVFHRDPGIGDGWVCLLPNGYVIEMIDVTDRGFLYNPQTQDLNSRETLRDVCVLQLAGRYILGGADCRTDMPHGPDNHDAVFSYFLLDAQTGKRSEFRTYEALQSAASQINVQLRFEAIDVVYGRYRFTWFDGAAALAMFGVPALYAFRLLRRAMRLRRSGTTLA